MLQCGRDKRGAKLGRKENKRPNAANKWGVNSGSYIYSVPMYRDCPWGNDGSRPKIVALQCD